MLTTVEALYENGMLRLLATDTLKEHGHYRVTLEEITPVTEPIDSELAAEFAQRTTVLPGGQRVVVLGGIFSKYLVDAKPDEDPVADTLDELRRERAMCFEAEENDFRPPNPPS